MRLLELFKGTGSVSEAFLDLYPNGTVVSLDIDPKCKATYVGDIMDFNFKQFTPGEFDIIWASPDCRIFSKVMCQWIGKKFKDRDELDQTRRDNWKYVRRVLEIIDHLQPQKWFIENPYSSAMSKVPELQELHNVRKDYCRYGTPYQKATRIWSNRPIKPSTCACIGKHAVVLGNTTSRTHDYSSQINLGNQSKLTHAIPKGLVRELFLS